VIIGNGGLTRFWLDQIYKEPLYYCAPVLFELCENKNITVAQAIGGSQITFRRWLFEDLRTDWNRIWLDA